MSRADQVHRSGKLLIGFNQDHALLQNKRRSVFDKLLKSTVESECQVLDLTVEEILYYAELPERENPRSESLDIRPFSWVGPARVEQTRCIQFLKNDPELNRELELVIYDQSSLNYKEVADTLTSYFFDHISEEGAFYGSDKTCPIAHIPNIFQAYFSAFIADYLYMQQSLAKNNIAEPTGTVYSRLETAEPAINMLRV